MDKQAKVELLALRIANACGGNVVTRNNFRRDLEVFQVTVDRPHFLYFSDELLYDETVDLIMVRIDNSAVFRAMKDAPDTLHVCFTTEGHERADETYQN